MVDGADRAPVATFHAPGAWAASVELDEAAAHHATVKRLQVGDPIRLSNGAGRRIVGRIDTLSKRRLVVACELASGQDVPPPPRLTLLAPIGDRDRMLTLAEKAVELGVSAWRSVRYRRSRSVSPRGEGDAFREKLRLRMVSALEQSGGAWLPELLPEQDVEQVVATSPASGALLLDALGAPIASMLPTLSAPVHLAVGPEGGLEPAERAAFLDAGWRATSLGDNVLRFETAGIAGVALIRAFLS